MRFLHWHQYGAWFTRMDEYGSARRYRYKRCVTCPHIKARRIRGRK